ncbi:MAG: UDP-N-acetylmuramoyl-tripeptide--D-alanyl-D-alanine ligase [Chloroflexota bacterium]|jgi:UDP-N-acetylmuramoyl-tripeptide--D-alanyl-D-alanine ligase
MLTIQAVAQAVGGHIIGEPADDQPITVVTIDSRQITPGALFVALKGQKHDGHEFLLDAFVRGARAALVERTPDNSTLLAGKQPPPLILVEDTMAAFQRLAHWWRKELGIKVIGVTGSVGKTTTKEVIASVLSQRFEVLKSEGNLNTETGVPLTLLKAQPRHQLLVLEMGMYAQGEIRALSQLACPNVGVVTNVGPTHLERLGTIERIAAAKAELVEELPEDGLAILNYDDSRVRAMASKTRAKVAYYGLSPEAEFWADAVHSRGLQGIQFDLRRGDEWVHVRMPLLGLHSVHAALAAAAVAYHQGMNLEEIAAGLHEVSSALRLIVAVGINGSTIIDDSYNASPASTLAALNLLSELEGRKVAVLGDMRELGSFTEEGHRMVGRRAVDVVDLLVVVGDLGEIIGREALSTGKDEQSVFIAKSNEEAIQQLKANLRPGDCVLVKGSRGMRMEEIVEAIRCPTH